MRLSTWLGWRCREQRIPTADVSAKTGIPLARIEEIFSAINPTDDEVMRIAESIGPFEAKAAARFLWTNTPERDIQHPKWWEAKVHAFTLNFVGDVWGGSCVPQLLREAHRQMKTW